MVRKAAKKDGGTKVLLNVSDFAPGEYSVSLKLIISGRSGERAIVMFVNKTPCAMSNLTNPAKRRKV